MDTSSQLCLLPRGGRGGSRAREGLPDVTTLQVDERVLADEAPKFAAFDAAVQSGDYARLLWVASVRGGKTATIVLALVRLIITQRVTGIGNGQYLLGGQTVEAIRRAQLVYWRAACKAYGLTFKNVRGAQNAFELPGLGVTIYLHGGAKKGDDEAILGQTLTAAYCDDAASLDEGFLLEVERRCSFKESLMIISSNGGMPTCGFNRAFWNDSEPKDDEPPTYRMLTTIDDNPYIHPDRRERYKNENRGSVGYAQRILGLFVAPEGLVVNIPPEAITSERPLITAPNGKPSGFGQQWTWARPALPTVSSGRRLPSFRRNGSISEAYVWNGQRQGIQAMGPLQLADMDPARWNIRSR